MKTFEPKAYLISKTEPAEHTGCKTIEEYIAWVARVSNPENRNNHLTGMRLVKYLIRKHHWSPLDKAFIGISIHVPRDISRQAIRHKSMFYQEFSQRYAPVTDFCLRECRLQDATNRQSSIEVPENSDIAEWWQTAQESLMLDIVQPLYNEALNKGIAKEVARAILPEGLTMSELLVTGSIRSWIHYCKIRRAVETQKEHRQIADACWEVLRSTVPTVVEAIENAQEQ